MLQTFPETYAFAPADRSIKFNRMGRLIGNAVPVRLGEVIAQSLIDHVRVCTIPTVPSEQGSSTRLR